MVSKTWRQLSLGEVAVLQRGYDLPYRARKHGKIPIVSSSGFIDTHNESRVAGPGVVTGRYGTIGEVFFISEDFWPLNTTLFVKDFKGNNPLFISFLLRTIDYQSYSGKSGVPGVNRNDLHEINVSLPPLSEQKGIATALSDVDALITSLDKLIAKKRDIKQATMQELLTGKTRLPGFSEEWKVKKIREIGTPYGGLSGKSSVDFVNGQCPYIPFLNIMNHPVINTNNFDYVNINPNENQNKAIKGDLFFNASSETPEEVGMCSVLNEDIPNLYLNSFCFGFRLNKELKTNGLYLSYYFRSSLGRQLFYSLAQGATRYNLSKSNFLRTEIPYPSPNEQQAIATILSDMEAEIVALERKRDKTRALKQGMMQELLTGKTRLYEHSRPDRAHDAESSGQSLQHATEL